MDVSDGDSCCPCCDGQVLQSQIEPDDRYWFCVEEMCDWQGIFSTPTADSICPAPLAAKLQRGIESMAHKTAAPIATPGMPSPSPAPLAPEEESVLDAWDELDRGIKHVLVAQPAQMTGVYEEMDQARKAMAEQIKVFMQHLAQSARRAEQTGSVDTR